MFLKINCASLRLYVIFNVLFCNYKIKSGFIRDEHKCLNMPFPDSDVTSRTIMQ